MRAWMLLVAVMACGDDSTPDAPTPDASTPDASTPDAVTRDAQTPDAQTDASLDALDASIEADARSVRPLDEFEALFEENFRARDADAIGALQTSGVGIHCLAASLALQRHAAGADFDDGFVAELRTAVAATVAELLRREPDFDAGWGEGEPRDFFGDGTTNDADTADGFNTSYAAWCLVEAHATLDDALAADARAAASRALAAYRDRAYVDSGDAEQHCDTCGYFWYSASANDAGRYVKNITALMGIASALAGDRFGDATSLASGRAALQSQSREIGADGTRNLTYLSRLDPLYDPDRQLYNTHNYIESFVMLHAGEWLRSEAYVCRALRQYRAWSAETLDTQPTQVAYASCHFARRDAEALERCQAWLDSGRGLTNAGGIGLVMDYWPEDSAAAESMCEP